MQKMTIKLDLDTSDFKCQLADIKRQLEEVRELSSSVLEDKLKECTLALLGVAQSILQSRPSREELETATAIIAQATMVLREVR